MSSGASVKGAAPFVSKLFDIISNASLEDSIRWGPAGDSIIITDANKFAKDVLPRYFKHDNIRSFARQLNIYGFKRCHRSGMDGVELEFRHENFIAGRKDLMAEITRGGLPAQKRRIPEVVDETVVLSSEMLRVHHQLTALDTQLSTQVQSLQGKMEALVNSLGSSSSQLSARDTPHWAAPSSMMHTSSTQPHPGLWMQAQGNTSPPLQSAASVSNDPLNAFPPLQHQLRNYPSTSVGQFVT